MLISRDPFLDSSDYEANHGIADAEKMYKASAGVLLPTSIIGSLPRPAWHTVQLGNRSFLEAMVGPSPSTTITTSAFPGGSSIGLRSLTEFGAI